MIDEDPFVTNSFEVFGLNFTLVWRLPFDGIISEKMVEETEFISVGTPLFTIIDLDPIKIEGYLSEFDVNKVSVGTKALIEDSNGIKKNGIITQNNFDVFDGLSQS